MIHQPGSYSGAFNALACFRTDRQAAIRLWDLEQYQAASFEMRCALWWWLMFIERRAVVRAELKSGVGRVRTGARNAW